MYYVHMHTSYQNPWQQHNTPLSNKDQSDTIPFQITVLDRMYYANFVVRDFQLEPLGGAGGVRRVSQYHFTAWPDHGVPDDPIPFIEFHMKVKRGLSNQNGPLLVHCGTGVSRTAVFIALDALLEQAKVENCVNVFQFCNKMRKGRVMMVRTAKQYRFIYDAILEAIITSHNVVNEDIKVNYRMLSQVNPVTKKSFFKEQFEVLEEFLPEMKPEEECKMALLEANRSKNRFSTILPPDKYRPMLRTPGGLGRTDYINAIYVDSYLLKESFIATQTPMENTVIDFWKLCYDYDVNCIVMLNSSAFREDTCAAYLPSRVGMEKYDPFFVKLTDVKTTEHCTVRTLQLSNALRPSDQPRTLRQFQFESWNMYEPTPWSRDGFIRLLELVNDHVCQQQGEGESPILVHCMDGAAQSGLFCACYVICEKFRQDGEVDIFHTIKHMKRRRPQFVRHLVSWHIRNLS